MKISSVQSMTFRRLSYAAGALLIPFASVACNTAHPTVAPQQLSGVRLVSDTDAVAGGAQIPPPPAATMLTDVGDSDDQAKSTGTYKFGMVTQKRSEPIVHDFELRNDSKNPVTIDRIQPQCGCTTAVIKNQRTAGDGPIAPGALVKIHVAVDPSHLIPGSVAKNTLVYIKGQTDPAATLVMSGAMQALASFLPSSISFGDVPAHETRSASLTVIYDKELLKDGPLPVPKFGRPITGMRLVPAEAPEADDPKVKTAGADLPKDFMGSDTIKKYYKVELTPDAVIGNSFASLALESTPKSGPLTAFTSITVNVVGDIQASPNSVAFGTVGEGTTQTQRLTITGKRAENTKKLAIKSDNDHVSVKYIPVPKNTFAVMQVAGTPNAQPELGTVEVTLKPDAPSGPLQAKVTVKTTDGQLLELPVWAYIPKVNK